MNIKEVARRAGVSTATVSRTINGSALVSADTAARVQRAVAELNFVPDTNARSLGSGSSNMLGLIISDITNPFFPELVKAFEENAILHGREILIANTDYDPERTSHCVTRMLQRRVDGVAIMTSETDAQIVRIFHRKHIPVCFFDHGAPSRGVGSVNVDYREGVMQAMRHLLDLGHRDIGFLSGPLRLNSARMRHEAFVAIAAEAGLRLPATLLQEGNHRPKGGYEGMERMLAGKVKPTAVLASNDMTAIGAMGRISECGLRVPEDISVIGFDDIQLSAYTAPPLTTVQLPRAEIAKAAIQSLLTTRGGVGGKRLAQGELHVIQPRLIVRRSTCPPAQARANLQRT